MSDQEIRNAVLTAMNESRKKARNESELQLTLEQIRRALRNAGYTDLTQQQVTQAVNYLKAAHMLKRSQETKSVKIGMSSGARSIARRTGSPTSFKHTTYRYTLDVKAIDLLEGETEFSKKPFMPLQSITINTSNAPVIVGNNNIVNTHLQLYQSLDELQQTLSEANELSVEERQDAVSDVESLKQQLAKPNPNVSVMAALWTTIGRAADLAGAGALAIQIAKAIAAATGHPIG
ncbi:MAG: hypothetical protein JWM81_314 [Candidatus Saccharibacteria bacterium]|nr:hypothetical protein [Candidatus Saccharibacteria bacterium]